MQINQIIYNCLTTLKEKLEDKISNEYYDSDVSLKLDFLQQWIDDSELSIAIPEQITKEWYRDVYLKSEHWKKKRLEALEYAKNLCQLCNKNKLLNVHHRTYENLGHEDIKDLITLCGSCHNKFHNDFNPSEGFKIPIKKYGTEGLMPIDYILCPYWQENQLESSCVSGSGGSCCGGFFGTENENEFVICRWNYDNS